MTSEVVTQVFSPVTPTPLPPKELPVTTLPPLIYHITAARGDDMSLLTFLTVHTPLTEATIKDLTKFGCVYLHHSPSPRRSPKPKRQTSAQLLETLPDSKLYIRIHAHPKRYSHMHAPYTIAERDGLVVVHKPAGIPTCASVDNSVECMTRYVNARVTTRLDIGTSGVLLMGRDREAVRRGNALVRRAHKFYLAFCSGAGAMRTGVWRDWYRRGAVLARGERGRILKRWDDAAEDDDDWAEARLELVDTTTHRGVVVACVRLITGRCHQIRVQMRARGWVVLGDHKYASMDVYRGGVVGPDVLVLGLHCWLVRCPGAVYEADIAERADLVGLDPGALGKWLEALRRRIVDGVKDC